VSNILSMILIVPAFVVVQQPSPALHVLGWTLVLCALVLNAIGARLYWHGVSERNNLSNYAGLLLLDDVVRTGQKQQFEDYIRNSPANNAQELSSRAMLAIDREANAAAYPKNSERVSSLLCSTQ
jgi:hypothetical protein